MSNEKTIRLTGVVTCKKTSPRKGNNIKEQDKDYFFCMNIIKVNDTEVKTIAEVFNLLNTSFPKITSAVAPNQVLNNLFIPAKLPADMGETPHITLGYFADFRKDRNTQNDIDEGKVIEAQTLEGETKELILKENDFELVTTYADTNAISVSKGEIAPKAASVGFERDAVINLKPSKEFQEELLKISRDAFGPDFKPFRDIAYHFTIGQTNQLSVTLDKIKQQANSQVQQQEVERVTEGGAKIGFGVGQ